MFEQRVTIQSLLCRTHGLSRYCSTSGLGPHPPLAGLLLVKSRLINVLISKCLLVVILGPAFKFQNRSSERASLQENHALPLSKRSSKPASKSNHKCATEALQSGSWQARKNSYLPDEGLHRDHVGGGPRARPDHCTSAGLTPAIIPNVDNSVV